ncbi:MAG: RNA processing factor Prp31 containing Nop domain SIK1 [Candidatus Methanohalarchaeum thermophilum]|uniref:RNA processing factor Prp31 containing Nop domain SIK1 n=1 Tax=Methanohalarchaeum thermophilum TaxID=1903181 RepID=A0A1Q6DXI7_METT1|nr:MAG: RNA processing factor Prp31 containing Nop domain SIK1 [Candidatus Methanohalarchaeum thermophilum]
MYIIKTWFGVFVVDGQDIVEENFYDKNVSNLVRKNSIDETEEEREIKEKYSLKKLEPEEKKQCKQKIFEKYIHRYEDIKKDFFCELSEKKTREKLRQKGDSIIRSINVLNDLNKSLGLLNQSVEEWASIEMEIEEAKKEEELDEESGSGALENTLEELESLKETKKSIEEYVEMEMNDFAPNISEIAGEILGAKLIKRAGGLEKLAKLPASTIQVLGAEKAFFRFKRKGDSPPKHGLIFEHPYIKRTKYDKRGKIARKLASTIAIAARIDYFSGKDKYEGLKKDLERRVKEVRGN